MTQDILDIMKKKEKNNPEKYKTLHKEIRKKCDEAKEKCINGKCRYIKLYHRTTEQTMYKNIEEISGKKTCSSKGCLLKAKKKKTATSFWKKKNPGRMGRGHR